MKHLFNGRDTTNSSSYRGSSSCSNSSSQSSSTTTTNTSSWQHSNSHFNSNHTNSSSSSSSITTPTLVVKRLLAAIYTVDSLAVVEPSTEQRLLSLIENGDNRCRAAELGKREVAEALKRAVAKEVARATRATVRLFSAGRKSGGEEDEEEEGENSSPKITSFSDAQKEVHRSADRVLCRLISCLEKQGKTSKSCAEEGKSSTGSETKFPQQNSPENSKSAKSSEAKSSQSQTHSQSLQSQSQLSPVVNGSSSASHSFSRAISSDSSSKPQPLSSFINAATAVSSSNSGSSTTHSSSSSNKDDDHEEEEESSLTDDSDEFDSGALMAKKKQQQQQQQQQQQRRRQKKKKQQQASKKKKKKETIKEEDKVKQVEKVESPIEDPGDELISWADACCTSPEPEEEELRQPNSPNHFHRPPYHNSYNNNNSFHNNRNFQEHSNRGGRGNWRGRSSPFGGRGPNTFTSSSFSLRTNHHPSTTTTASSSSTSEFYYQSASATAMEPASSSIKDEHSNNNSSSEENGFSKSQTGPSGPRRIMNFMSPGAMPHYPGVNDERMNEILNRTGYYLELSNGQRKYGPPQSHPSYRGGPPQQQLSGNSEVFVGRIPREIFEDELIPLFEAVGQIYDLRLMIDPLSGYSRGYAFITYFKAEEAACCGRNSKDKEFFC
ncbi:hypothetical protein TYRP_020289 [Tyrophagus putrescentiae]|nr:hypothetical protein TYRP_020289 [Tyrophagus putrescentiae]